MKLYQIFFNGVMYEGTALVFAATEAEAVEQVAARAKAIRLKWTLEKVKEVPQEGIILFDDGDTR